MYIDRLEADGKLSKLLNILVAIIIFSVIVVFHELGHFLLAKKNGIEVTEFSLGMGPRLLSTVKGNTRYSLKLFPIGGSCMMVGEDGEEDGPGSFGHASVWGRISVVAAGPIFNFILAFVFALVITSVMGYDPPKVLSVEENSPAEKAGLQVGDIITSFQGKHISIGRDISLYESLYGMQQDQIKMTVKRDGKKIDLNFKAASEKKYMLGFSYVPDGEPEITEVFVDGAMMKAGVLAGDVITAVDGTKVSTGEELQTYLGEHPLGENAVTITVSRDGKEKEFTVQPTVRTQVSTGFVYNLYREKTNFFGVLKYSAVEVRYWISSTIDSLGLLIKGTFRVNDLSGPVGIVDAIGSSVEEAKSEGTVVMWMQMFYWAILLSANLGVMNLLPLPALDGGRLVFLLIEAVTKKKVNPNIEGMIHFAGFVLLMALMVFVFMNDIKRL
ncbi:RIP metalloprotease RseP [Firmicutes bacterium OM04-13BH]|nr:RIP metalloprotease RseP [Firmicutes bacterium AM10-47]RHV47622.1 RIP metalloprotease RseP [Firmicutes bacterium OM04-13BH]